MISGMLASALKLSVVDPAKGIWKFRDDPPSTTREECFSDMLGVACHLIVQATWLKDILRRPVGYSCPLSF